MDLRKLKNYLKCNYNEMERNCYLMFNDYVISDKYSIICLNNSNGLNVVTSKENNMFYEKLKGFRSEFKYQTHFYKDLDIDFKNKDKDFEVIDDKFEISLKNVKEIKNLIKADKFEVLTTDNLSSKYIIKIENTKTYEVGYLLPCRVY